MWMLAKGESVLKVIPADAFCAVFIPLEQLKFAKTSFRWDGFAIPSKTKYCNVWWRENF